MHSNQGLESFIINIIKMEKTSTDQQKEEQAKREAEMAQDDIEQEQDDELMD